MKWYPESDEVYVMTRLSFECILTLSVMSHALNLLLSDYRYPR